MVLYFSGAAARTVNPAHGLTKAGTSHPSIVPALYQHNPQPGWHLGVNIMNWVHGAGAGGQRAVRVAVLAAGQDSKDGWQCRVFSYACIVPSAWERKGHTVWCWDREAGLN